MRIYVEEIAVFHTFRGEPPWASRRGRYSARLDSPEGEIIVMSSCQPLVDAACVLKGRGLSGKLEMWGKERPYARLIGDIDTLAGLDVSESSSTRLKRYRRSLDRPPAATDDAPATHLAKTTIGRPGDDMYRIVHATTGPRTARPNSPKS